MFKRMIASAVFLILVCTASSSAQSDRFEASVFAGWSFSDGVSASQAIVTPAGTFNREDPKDSGVWGLGLGVHVSPQAEVGFMFTRASSALVLGGTAGTPDVELGNMGVYNYHGYFSYNFSEDTNRIRPFVYGGLGATNFGAVNYNTPLRSGTIGGNTQFSTTWGGGVKYFVKPHWGIRAAASWTPVYIKSDAVGWWCDPFWGCYLIGSAQYANSFHLTGGLTVKF
jgi:hypothetical protein